MKNQTPQRTELNQNPDSATFRSFYYLKAELADFCRANGLSASGSKQDLTERVAYFLDTGEALPVQPANKPKSSARQAAVALTEEALIEEGFVCSQRHRAFFQEKIGKGFSFNVAFQQWLKGNPGKTYGQAVTAYHALRAEKKKGKTAIDKQFAYNTYIRDFFADNKGKTLAQAILCWQYKKSLPGHNRYERADLRALTSGENGEGQ